ncbi:hypothetical protein [Enemella evansiae]|uniref:hypothetical protein n=1 Tax=Enemella evansiae TaxID=2016499 RepID=UPI000B9639E1|nr:hypothetical protein [Enemella evansiae]
MDAWWLVVVLVVGIPLAIAITIAVRRQIRINKLRGHGWAFESAPGPEPAYRLNCPPFGLGERRRVKDLITGQTAGGTPFKVFRYDSDGFDNQVLVLPLPRSVPETRFTANGWQGQDPAFIDAIRPAVEAATAGYRAAPLHLSLDGAALVLCGVPVDPDELKTAVEQASAIQRALVAAIPVNAPQPLVPNELSVHGRPHWTYREQDDSWLDVVRTNGARGEAERVLFGEHHGMRWVALTHHWTTTTTTTSTDSEGRTQTQTQTHHHREDLFEVWVPSGFGNLSLNRFELFARPITFESAAFNRRFKVRGDDPRFCHDVIHPRMMEFLMARGAPAFDIDGGVYRTDFAYSHEAIDHHLEFLRQFLSWVPSFVWENIGHPDPPDFGPKPLPR